jgi:hypothetical protein
MKFSRTVAWLLHHCQRWPMMHQQHFESRYRQLPWSGLWFPSDDDGGVANHLYLVLACAIGWPYHVQKLDLQWTLSRKIEPLGLIIGSVMVGFSVFRQGESIATSPATHVAHEACTFCQSSETNPSQRHSSATPGPPNAAPTSRRHWSPAVPLANRRPAWPASAKTSLPRPAPVRRASWARAKSPWP